MLDGLETPLPETGLKRNPDGRVRSSRLLAQRKKEAAANPPSKTGRKGRRKSRGSTARNSGLCCACAVLGCRRSARKDTRDLGASGSCVVSVVLVVSIGFFKPTKLRKLRLEPLIFSSAQFILYLLMVSHSAAHMLGRCCGTALQFSTWPRGDRNDMNLRDARIHNHNVGLMTRL